MRKLLIGGTVALASVLGLAAPAFAHDCFNPNKPAGAGVHAELVGFDANGAPIFNRLDQSNGNGGFVSLTPLGAPAGTEAKTLGAGNNPHGVAGGPGSQTDAHACDGKGIDYLEACGFGG